MEEQIYQVNPNVIFEELQGGALLLDTDDFRLAELSSTALIILKKTDGLSSVTKIARDIAIEYGIDESSAFQDVRTFYEQLSDKKIVRLLSQEP
ncbi:MAG TPA: PqqD family protein [Anaerolineaceae bacterium]|nr:PqqD family protein [Anaerolineaceae bacterium]